MDISDLREMMQTELEAVHTTLAGKIVSWDGSRAVVRPALPRAMRDGSALPAPQIVSVPVCFPVGAGGAAMISVPLAAGDDVLLHFSETAIDGWLSGSDAAPDDPRRFDLSDCFASPVLRPTVGAADTENVSLSFGAGSLKIAPSGEITIAAPKVTINAPVINNGLVSINQGMNNGAGGAVACSGGFEIVGGDVVADGISHKWHTHRGDSGGTTGAAQ